jgi:DNA-binding PadR family transcriptional regulator
MHKALLVLGLLQTGPKSGYDIHRIVRAHGELYTDLKKANLYYLLEQLAKEGCLQMQVEPGARGPRGERLIYSLTEHGKQQFQELLRTVLREYTPIHSGVEIAVVFLGHVSNAEAITLLEQRHKMVAGRRALVASELGDFASHGTLQSIAADHLLSQIDAELAWVERSLAQFRVQAKKEKAGTPSSSPVKRTRGRGK